MDDISAKLNEILSDPQSMQQIQNIMGSLGMNQEQNSGGNNAIPQPATGGMPDLSALNGILGSMGGTGQNQSGGASVPNTGGMPDLSALSGLLGSMGGMGGNTNTAPASAPAAPSPMGGDDAANTAQMMATISRIAPMLRKANEEDDSTRFLRALRPLLGEARRKKLDESIKMMQMMRMLPLLKSSGVLSGLLG